MIAPPRLLATIRAVEWWDEKLAPALGVAYATAFLLDVDLLDHAGTFVLVLGGLILAATYTSLVNDASDRELDRRVGKPNRLAGRSHAAIAALLGGCLAAGVALGALAWGEHPAALGAYAGSWIAFTLYSVAPVRLKARGVAGAVADAAGAHLFPALLGALAVAAAWDRDPGATWLVLVGAWSLLFGLRGALWHELGDAEVDRRAGVRTPASVAPRRTRWVAERVLFPLELVALGALLVDAGSVLALAALPVYGALELARARRRGVRFVVVQPEPGARIVLHEYATVFLPLAFLIGCAWRHPADLVVLVAHVAVFWRSILRAARDAAGMAYRVVVPRERASRHSAVVTSGEPNHPTGGVAPSK